MKNELIYQSPRVNVSTLELDVTIATGSVEVEGNLQGLNIIEENW